MNSPSSTALIEAIHAAPTLVVIAATGGGSQAIARLLEVGGASRTVLEAIVPYSAAALDDWLHARPEHYCSPQTARAMAMAAFERARRLIADEGAASDRTDLAGIACTASLASDRPKRGAHRAHIAVQTARFTATWSVQLVSGRRTRAEEERVVAELVLAAAATACGVNSNAIAELQPDEPLTVTRTDAPPHWTELLLGERRVASGHAVENSSKESRVIFPGAFNPRHSGHRRMAEIAAERTGAVVAHEISLLNVDKPPLDFTDLAERASRFAADEPLWITRAATFRDKADIFPDAAFVVGVDTIERIAEPRYYSNDTAARDAAIAHLVDRDCRFLVFGRAAGDDFKSLSDLALPKSLADLCEEVPGSVFREDISSTAIRKAEAANQ
jgi:nicotinamide mononucleotide (NMN) deamidase PncC